MPKLGEAETRRGDVIDSQDNALGVDQEGRGGSGVEQDAGGFLAVAQHLSLLPAIRDVVDFFSRRGCRNRPWGFSATGLGFAIARVISHKHAS